MRGWVDARTRRGAPADAQSASTSFFPQFQGAKVKAQARAIKCEFVDARIFVDFLHNNFALFSDQESEKNCV